ncbi:hypothetical protein POV27_08015 [Aureisphaera galaxeae]|uniref:tetratricopeptide repeat protein n=1 Tax=Aureisphaera galaxeae TaxID=1538023 RepID=UPI002350C9BA|nr:hypothetical protein [Aureisphaera galaxeae]MDC8003994.1 hypothetical protein [Aureisphaera galaxeae]
MIIFLIITLPSILLSYYEIYQYTRANEVSNYLKVDELLEDQKAQDSLLRTTISVIEKIEPTLTERYNLQGNDSLYHNVVEAFEYENMTKLRESIKEAFEVDSLDYDEMLGYVVAGYVGLKDYANATKMVLERDKSLPEYNHSLKLDIIYCLRNARLRHGAEYAENLADSLKGEYGNKIITNVWAHTPYSIATLMEKGIHPRYLLTQYVSDASRDRLREVIDDNDPYCSYGYYLIGDYEKALSCNPNSRIKDILIYASGYEKVKQFYEQKSEKDFSLAVISFMSGENDVTRREKSLLQEAIQFFSQYANNPSYSELPHYDDSLYWMAWCYAQMDDNERALEVLRGLNEGDYVRQKTSLEPVLISRMGNNVSRENLDYVLGNVLNSRGFHWDTRNFRTLISRMDNSAILAIIQEYPEKASHGVNYFLKEKMNKNWFDENTLQLCNSLLSGNYRISEEIRKTAEQGVLLGELKTTNDVNRFLALQKELTYNISPSTLAEEIENGMQRFSNSNKMDYLHYLLIRKLVVADPTKVEAKVAEFMDNYPDSDLADDALAEGIYNFFKNLEDPNKGLNLFNTLLLNYNNTNAVDNVIYHIADFYNKECCCSYYESSNMAYSCRTAVKYADIIVQKYPESSYYFRSQQIINKAVGLLYKYNYSL